MSNYINRKKMKKYKVFTDKGSWGIEALDDYDAMRLALFYCWRDDEKFHHIIREDSFAKYELRIAIV